MHELDLCNIGWDPVVPAASEADVRVLGELELTAFGSVFIGLPGFEEELVVAIKGNGVLGMVDDTDVNDDIFQSAVIVW